MTKGYFSTKLPRGSTGTRHVGRNDACVGLNNKWSLNPKTLVSSYLLSIHSSIPRCKHSSGVSKNKEYLQGSSLGAKTVQRPGQLCHVEHRLRPSLLRLIVCSPSGETQGPRW